MQYIGTIVATFAGVGLAAYFGIRQVYFQMRRADDQRRDQLLTALAGEIRVSQRTLSGERTPIRGSPTHEEFGKVILVPLPHVVIEETARSALFTTEQTDEFFNLAGNIQVNNNEISFLFATRTGLVTREALQLATQELEERQDALRETYEDLLRRIEF